jgi:hypothetical protein
MTFYRRSCPGGLVCITLVLDTNELIRWLKQMDFRQTSQPSGGRPVAPTPVASTPERKEEKHAGSEKRMNPGKMMRVAYLVLLAGVAILLLCIVLGVGRNGSSSTHEAKYVQTSKYQAVFLNNGQVYFGSIKSLNDEYVRMSNIYYLTQNGDSGSNYSLVKLGCQQIHDPLDQMVINRSQVTFWENLNADGKVVKSIQEFQKQNPNGPDCSQVSNQTQASGSSSQSSQNSNSTGTGSGTGSSSTNSSSSTTNK